MLFCPRNVVKCYCWALFLGGPDIYKNVPNYYEKVTVDHFTSGFFRYWSIEPVRWAIKENRVEF